MGVLRGTWGLVAVNLSPARVPVPRTAREWESAQGHLILPFMLLMRKPDRGKNGVRNLPPKHVGSKNRRNIGKMPGRPLPSLHLLRGRPSYPIPSPQPQPPAAQRWLFPVAPTLDETGRNQQLEQKENLQVTFPFPRTQRLPR